MDWSTYGLPEDEEDDEFDGKKLEEGSKLDDIEMDLVIELDDVVHGHRNSYRRENFDLFQG